VDTIPIDAGMIRIVVKKNLNQYFSIYLSALKVKIT